MTVRDTSNATGIDKQVIYRHLHTGDLAGEWTGSRWEIPAGECISWSNWLWRQGRVLQFPPPYPQRFIEHFNLK